MPACWISIGSNIEPARHVRAALGHLQQSFGALRVSPVYETPAVGFSGDAFLNLVVGMTTAQTPEAVIAELRRIEDVEGRVRGAEKFAARTLDLDLLTYGTRTTAAAGKTLPHPDILAYDFVLRPLAELAPDETHPVLQRGYAELWAEFSRTNPASSMREVAAIVPPAPTAG